ncbi:MAG: rhomboid family intramembrane serine protease [Chloroflexia bacterium]
MIPIGDTRSRFGSPWATYTLVILLAVGLIVEHTLDPGSWRALAEVYALHLDRLAAEPPQRLLLISITYPLLQGGAGVWLEPVVNLLYLWVLGRKVEDVCGSGRFLGLYALLGLSGAAAVRLFQRWLPAGGERWIYGQAAIVAGLMGAYLVLYRGQPLRAWVPPLFLPAVPFGLHLLFWAGLEFVDLHPEALRPLRPAKLISIEHHWPLMAALVIGMVAGYLFVRQEYLYYRSLRPQVSR